MFKRGEFKHFFVLSRLRGKTEELFFFTILISVSMVRRVATGINHHYYLSIAGTSESSQSSVLGCLWQASQRRQLPVFRRESVCVIRSGRASEGSERVAAVLATAQCRQVQGRYLLMWLYSVSFLLLGQPLSLGDWCKGKSVVCP